MARIRELLLTLASGSVFYSGLVPALGLGEINLHSALNQPLDAEIGLYQVGDLGSDEIKVHLAPAESFSRAGVERGYFLSDLRFVPVLDGARSRIRVLSSKPVREPYLNFIVEVVRPGGSLLREYTVLIDPPGMAYDQPAAPRTLSRPERSVAAATPRTPPAATRGERYRVQHGDSLWSIAGQLQAGGAAEASRETLMADIQALNPGAFAGGDSARLRAGADLLLPDSAAASAPATAAAAPQAPAQPLPQNQAEAAVAVEQRQLDDQLATVTAQNQALQDNLLALQQQLALLQAQMAEKDQQLQLIQERLQQHRDEPRAPAAEPLAAPVTPAAAEPARDSLLPWLIAAPLALLLLAVAWLLGRRRAGVQRARPQAPAPEPLLAASAAVQPQATPAPAPGLAPARPAVGGTDLLEGANMYIAYGRFAEAANALHRGIALEPARFDLRLRLLEVLGELGDGAAFAAQQHELQAMGASAAQIEPISARYAARLQQAQGEQPPLADAVLLADEQPAPVLQDDFQLNLDDLTLDADWGLASPFQPQPARSRTAAEPEAEFHSDLRQLPHVLEMDDFEGFAHEPLADDELTEDFTASASLDHLAGNREHLATLNMALAYIAQGDIGNACDVLNEVISTGDQQEREQARALLAKIA